MNWIPTEQELANIVHPFFWNVIKDSTEDYYGENIIGWKRWLDVAGPYEASLSLDSDPFLYTHYWSKLPEDITIQDVLEMYQQGQLSKGPAPRYQHQQMPMDMAPQGVDRNLPWQKQVPAEITPEVFQQTYALAKSKMVGPNKDEVANARKQIYLAFNTNPEVVEASGIHRAELNKFIRGYSGLTVAQKRKEEQLNFDVPDEHQWVGFSNTSWAGRQNINPEDLEQFVKSITITPKARGWQANNALRSYVINTFMAIDTRVEYKDLNFEVGQCEVRRGKKHPPNGEFTTNKNGEPLIRINDLSQHTVAHEIGHYLDDKWGDQYSYGNSYGGFLSEAAHFHGPPEHKQWAESFTVFSKNIHSKVGGHSEYHYQPKEVFARFIDAFQRWASPGSSYVAFDRYMDDRFEEIDFRTFVRILQEKSYVDAKYPLEEKK